MPTESFPAVQPVSGPLTDEELRDSPVSVAVNSSSLPSGAATEATLLDVAASVASIDGAVDVALSTRATETTLVSVDAHLNSLDTDFDVALSTRATATSQTDGTQRAMVEGRAADGASIIGNPVLIGGQDGSNAQSVLTDTSGRLNIVGAANQGAAVTGNPILLAAEDSGGLTQRLQTTGIPPVGSEPGLVTRQVVSQTAATSTVAASVSSVQLFAANTSRIRARIVNDSNKLLYVKAGTTASATDYTKLLGAGEDWLVDAGYIGRIDGIWESANGSARLTEYT